MKKSINELYQQLTLCCQKNTENKVQHTDRFTNIILHYYPNAFYQHFNCHPHTKECRLFIQQNGKDYQK